MSDFRWIALALTVTAGCQVYDRVPWRRGWGWLTAKALALRSWTFDDGYDAAGYSGTARDADDWSPSRYDETRRVVHSEGCPRSEFGICSCDGTSEPALPDPYEPLAAPRRRPSRKKKVKP